MSRKRSQDVSVRQLARIRDRLGPLVVLDYSALSLKEAHYRLGREVAEQVHRWLASMINELSSDQLQEAIRAARRSATEVRKKTENNEIAPEIREALVDYSACLAAWSRGAALDEFAHRIKGLNCVDGEPVTPLDLAFMLQTDTVGCQTGVMRAKSGDVVLWHTEEDMEEEIGSRFDRLRLVVLNMPSHSGNIKAYAFVYPDLLPGLAFAWRTDGFVQAVDALILRPQAGAMYANVAAWVLLRLGPSLSSEKVITSLAPFADGYAIVTVAPSTESVVAHRIEFAGQWQMTSELGISADSMLFQVNVFSNPDAPITLACEGVSLDGRDTFEKRIERTEHALAQPIPENNLPAALLRLLSSRDGGAYAYANGDVKAYIVCRVSQGRLEARLGTGPALKRVKPSSIVVEW